MKTDRLIGIIMALLNHDRISAPKLAEMFEVSTRTIYRDMESISMAGIPILAEPGMKGGISILPQYKVNNSLFTENEMSTLLIGLNALSPTLGAGQISGALEKIKALLPTHNRDSLELKASQISIDLTGWKGQTGVKDRLNTIKEALDHSMLLDFKYTSYKQGTISRSQRSVEPYQLVLKEGHWYLQAFCKKREDHRVFKLSRMENLRISKTSFKPRDFFPKPLGGTEWVKDRLVAITVLAHPSLWEDISTFSTGKTISRNSKGWLQASIYITEDDHGYRKLQSYGDKLQCLGPERIRRELIQRIKKSLKAYEKE